MDKWSSSLSIAPGRDLFLYLSNDFKYNCTFSQEKKKRDNMTVEEAIDDSENLTDFLLDFEEDDE